MPHPAWFTISSVLLFFVVVFFNLSTTNHKNWEFGTNLFFKGVHKTISFRPVDPIKTFKRSLVENYSNRTKYTCIFLITVCGRYFNLEKKRVHKYIISYRARKVDHFVNDNFSYKYELITHEVTWKTTTFVLYGNTHRNKSNCSSSPHRGG